MWRYDRILSRISSRSDWTAVKEVEKLPLARIFCDTVPLKTYNQYLQVQAGEGLPTAVEASMFGLVRQKA